MTQAPNKKGAFKLEKGWVKLYRRMLENPFLMHDNSAFLVFCKLLMAAGKEKGQWSGGRYQLSELMNINANTLYNVLQRLKNNGMISIETNSNYSVITIVNWNNYQSKTTTKTNTLSTRQSTLTKQMSIEYHQQDNQQSVNRASTARQHSNKNKKENKNNITNVILAKPEIEKVDNRNVEINNLFEIWHDVIGFKIEGHVQANRYAASNLLKKHGKDGVVKLIHGVCLSKQDRFGPRIADFTQLQSKYNDLISWGHSQNNKVKVGIVE